MQMIKNYTTKKVILNKAREILNKSLRDVIPFEISNRLNKEIIQYNNRRKGFLGEIVERYFFEIEPGNASEPDFKEVGVELKVTPLKENKKKKFASKERLVFSMINYKTIVSEKWETSSFLKKNRTLLLMFYLWMKDQDILDHKFKFVHLLNLLDDISDEDVYQIQKDWEFIVNKIKSGEAHLLSEGDTYYLGACTKAANSSVVRDQLGSQILAKPRAFSFKQQYLNFLIQKHLLKKDVEMESIIGRSHGLMTLEDAVKFIFEPFIGKTDTEILVMLKDDLKNTSYQYRRLLVNKIFGVKSNKIEELEKANITLKVIAIEPNGTLKESVSFPHFEFKDLVMQVWYDEDNEKMSDLHAQLEIKRFLFVIFQKTKNGDLVLKTIKFWNFPMRDIDKVRDVWEKTIELINKGKIVKEIKKQRNGKWNRMTFFPGQKFNGIVHVRPHGKNAADEIDLVVPDQLTGVTKYTKQCFWINSKYLKKELELDQI